MATYNYGIGGTEVKQDASESIADIPQNRTMFVQKLTDTDPVKPEAVEGLTTVEEVFAHFKPEVGVSLENEEGAEVQENLRFANLGDFSIKNITAQSKYLNQLNGDLEQYQKIVKQLKSNKLLKTVMENPELKNAFMDGLKAMIQDLEENK